MFGFYTRLTEAYLLFKGYLCPQVSVIGSINVDRQIGH